MTLKNKLSASASIVMMLTCIFIAVLVIYYEPSVNADPLMARPLGMLDVPAVDALDPEYMALADEAGWTGAAAMANDNAISILKVRDRNRMRKFLNDSFIQAYDITAVEAYMNALVAQQKDIRWVWFPLSGRQVFAPGNTVVQSVVGQSGTWITTRSDSGQYQSFSIIPHAQGTEFGTRPDGGYGENYVMPMPKRALEITALIRDEFPDATLDVTAVAPVVKDPFLSVFYAGERIVVYHWDEPNFK